MEKYIIVLLIIPIVGFFVSLILHRTNEKWLSRTAFLTTGVNLLAALFFTGYWLFNNRIAFNLIESTVYKDEGFNFFIDLYFDASTAVFLLVGCFLTFMVVRFSSIYMHKESGFKRYFNNILFFYIGYLVVVLAGNFETLFVGWEILGLSSFLLIAFYQLRYLPVKNGIKVFSIYRLGDIGMILAMWMSHHLWHENITFSALHNQELLHEHLSSHSEVGIFISIMLLLAAAAKSAQLPFTSWLPRAMEGPTPSSAIFYGSLSVHMGAFLLLRTQPFWEQQTSVVILIILVGLTTAILGHYMSGVQTTIKGKIAYSSAGQIGLIFIEIALGLDWLALIHFAGNAFLRSYQLLISPSVVSYLIREQFFTFQKPEAIKQKKRYDSLRNAFYLLSLKEWHLESLIFRILFKPLKRLRNLIGFINIKTVFWILIPLYLVGVYYAYFDESIYVHFKYYLSIATLLLAFLFVSKSYNERSSSRLAWTLSVFAHFFIDLSITFNDHLNVREAGIYLSGIFVSGAIGFICLQFIYKKEGKIVGLNRFHGLIMKYPKLGIVFLLSALGVAGFPITSAFLGEDLILTHIHEDQWILAILFATTFIVNGIALIRMYARVFLGHATNEFQTIKDLTI